MEQGGIEQPEMVGRAGELDALRERLAHASGGRGSAVFISGEAGLGKTRLVSELIRHAEAEGFLIIRGWCLAESLEPLMPLRSALREAGLLHLVTGDPPPLVVSAYLVNDDGMLIAGSEREGLSLDPMIFSSMLKAVGDFVKDSMRMVDGLERPGGLNILGYGDYKIIMEEAGGIHLACVTKGSFSEFLVTDMREMLAGINARFGSTVTDWDGDMDSVEGVAAHVSGLVESGKYSGRFLVDDPKLRQENLFDNVLLGLQRASAERPVLLFLDDLQWSDPTTLKLLHYLARNTRSERMLILGTYRPEDITHPAHPLGTAMQEMSREDCLVKLELRRLDLDSTEKVIVSALGSSDLDSEFHAMVQRETGGTPLFILEVLKMLAAEGLMARDAQGRWSLSESPERLQLPEKVFDVVKRRLDRLTGEQREMLECASVIGEDFTADVLASVSGMDRIPLLKTLSQVESSHRLIHSSGRTYCFDHAKVREVLYGGIMDELRQEYHRMVAEALSGMHGGDTGPVLNELAHHYRRAGDPRAGPLLVMVGDMAMERYSNQEAIEAYRDSLDFLPEHERTPVTERLGDLLALTGKYDRAIETFEQLAGQGGTDAPRMLRKLGNVHLGMGDFSLSLETFERARSLARGPELGRVIFGQGCAHQRKGDNHMALELIREALAIFEGAGEERDIANALRYIGTIHWNNGDYREAMAHHRRSLEMMEALKDENGAAAALANIGIVHWNRGEYDMALECYGRSLGIMERVGNRAGMATVLANIGLVHWDKGELERSLEHQERSLRMFGRIGDQRGTASVLGNISLVHRDNGSLETALEFQKRSLVMRERMGDQSGIALSLNNIGELQMDLGEPERAREFHGMSLDICRDTGDRRVTVHNLCGLAEASMNMGDAESALENIAAAVSTALEIGARFEEGMSRRIRGALLRNSGDLDAAADEFAMAAAVLGDIGDCKELAKLMYEQAALHEALGDGVKAGDCLQKALVEFERMGMRLWADRCRKALGR